jgi:GDP-D-mannose dehydratase
VPDLRGDPSRIEALGWRRDYDFTSLIGEMVEHAIRTTH